MRARFFWVFPLYLTLGTSALYYAAEGKVLVDRPIWRTSIDPATPPPTGKKTGGLVWELSGEFDFTLFHETEERRIPWLRLKSPDLEHQVVDESRGSTTMHLASPTMVFYRFDEALQKALPTLRVDAQHATIPGMGPEISDLDFSEPLTLDGAHIRFESDAVDSPAITLDAPRVICHLAAPTPGTEDGLASLDLIEAFASEWEPVHVATRGLEFTSQSVSWRHRPGEGHPLRLVFGDAFQATMLSEADDETKPRRRTTVDAPDGLTVTWQPSSTPDTQSPGLFDVPERFVLEQSIQTGDAWNSVLRVTGRDALVHFTAAAQGRGSGRIHEVEVLEDVTLEGEFGELKGGRTHVLFAGSEVQDLKIDGPFQWRPSGDVDFLDELFPPEAGQPRRQWESRASVRFRLMTIGPPRFFRAATRVLAHAVAQWPAGRTSPRSARRDGVGEHRQAFADAMEPYVGFFARPRRLLVWEGRPAFGSIGDEPLARADDRILLVVDPRRSPGERDESMQPVVMRAEGNPVFEVPGFGRAGAAFLESQFPETEGGITRLRLRGEPRVDIRKSESFGDLTLACRDHLDLDKDEQGIVHAVMRGSVRMDGDDPKRGPQHMRCERLDIVRKGLDANSKPLLDVDARGKVDFREPTQGSVLVGEALHIEPGGFLRLEGWPARVDMLVQDAKTSESHLVKVRAPLLIAHPETKILFGWSMPVPLQVEVPKTLLPADAGFQDFEGDLILRSHLIATAPAGQGDLALRALFCVDVRGPLDVQCQMLTLQPDAPVIARFDSLGASRVEFDGEFEGRPARGSCRNFILHTDNRLDLQGEPELEGQVGFEFDFGGESSPRDSRRSEDGKKQRIRLVARDRMKLSKRWVELLGDAEVHQESLDPDEPGRVDILGRKITLERSLPSRPGAKDGGKPVNLVIDGEASLEAEQEKLKLVIRGTRIQFFVPRQKLEIQGIPTRPADVIVRSTGNSSSWEGQELIWLDLARRLPDRVKPFR
ncbi:MAG: hypothetical protein H6834_13105 [Planctomycetes bacterium]|nr:hypothetical protein [Planctomycetota bacterium]